MAEEIQNPTQTSEAPQTEATPGDQAGSLRQSQDPPAGDPPVDSAGSKTYSQEYVNRLKASAEGSKAEVDRLKSTQNQQSVIEKYRESQTQQMQPQPQQQYQQPQQQPVNYQDTAPHSFLSTEEESELTAAYESLDSPAIQRLNNINTQRAVQSSQMQLFQVLGAVNQQDQVVGDVTSEINASPESKDPGIHRQLISETITIMQNPRENAKYAQAQVDVAGVGMINPHIYKARLQEMRVKQAGAVRSAQSNISPENQNAMNTSGGPSSATPQGSADSFDSSVHLKVSERSMIGKAIHQSGNPYSDMDIGDAYRKHWNGLGDGVKSKRLSQGVAQVNPEEQTEGKAARKVWTSKKKKS
jgi:hypothetical protein